MTGSQLSALDGLAGLKEARVQLEEWLAVVRAERARENLGMTVSRPIWKNLVFTGGPGTGKSYAARAVASAYADLGFIRGGQVLEAAAAGMSGWTVRETRKLVNEAIGRAMGRVLMITGAQAWRGHAGPRCGGPGRAVRGDDRGRPWPGRGALRQG